MHRPILNSFCLHDQLVVFNVIVKISVHGHVERVKEIIYFK